MVTWQFGGWAAGDGQSQRTCGVDVLLDGTAPMDGCHAGNGVDLINPSLPTSQHPIIPTLRLSNTPTSQHFIPTACVSIEEGCRDGKGGLEARIFFADLQVCKSVLYAACICL